MAASSAEAATDLGIWGLVTCGRRGGGAPRQRRPLLQLRAGGGSQQQQQQQGAGGGGGEVPAGPRHGGRPGGSGGTSRGEAEPAAEAPAAGAEAPAPASASLRAGEGLLRQPGLGWAGLGAALTGKRRAEGGFQTHNVCGCQAQQAALCMGVL